MKYTSEQIINALRHVIDPDLKEDLIRLNMIEDIRIVGHSVSFTLVLTTPACPMKDKIEQDCIDAIHTYVSPDLLVKLNTTARVTTRRDKNELLPKVKNVILVASGKGGVGKSTVAANLAIALAQSGAEVGLMDADIHGPSLPLMFNLQGQRPDLVKIDGKNHIVPMEAHGIKAISIGLLIDEGQAVVWRGPMVSSALRQFITDVQWGELDYLVVDMPPGTGDIHLTIAQLINVAGAVVVTTPQQVAVADARKGAAMFRMPQINIPILGVVENMAYFTPEKHPDEQYYLFGKGGGTQLAKELDVPLLGQIPVTEHLAEWSDQGSPIVTHEDSLLSKLFKDLSMEVARQLALLNAQS